ncbi:MAG: hypothetical protein AAGH15_07670 [Myxococcota bacterium]
MGRLLLLLLAVLVTALMLAGLVTLDDPSQRVLGMPAVSLGGSNETSWLVLGGGKGVLVIGGGVGLVLLGFVGAGVFFALGQAAIGLVAVAQAGVGLFAFFGQLGGGFAALAQLPLGIVTRGQVRVGAIAGDDHFTAASRELGALLRFRSSGSP